MTKREFWNLTIRPSIVTDALETTKTIKVPHLPEDLGVVFYAESKENNGFLKITDEVLSEIDTTIEHVANAAVNDEPTLADMEQVLFEHLGMFEADNLLEQEDPEPTPMMVLTRKSMFRGAGVATDLAVLIKVANVVKGNYFMIPSSIHEWIIIPDNGMINMPISDMVNIIRQVNNTEVRREDWLSDNLYYFDAVNAKVVRKRG